MTVAGRIRTSAVRAAAVAAQAIVLAGMVATAGADTLQLATGERIAGRIAAFDRTTVRFAPGCEGGEAAFPWQGVARIAYGGACAGEADPDPSPVAEDCRSENFVVFRIAFRGNDEPVVAENAAATRDRILHLDLFEPWNQAHGTVDAVRQVARVAVCRNEIRPVTALPPSYCTEGRQVAVAFDYRTPLNNRILTNGFSFYTRVSGAKPDGFDLDLFRGEVRSAFRHGLTLWMSALQERRHLLTDPVRRFIDSRISRSATGVTMLLPPQVVELTCPQAATFVVDLSFGNRALFPRPPLVIAKARTEGRTIALNVSDPDIGCFRTKLHFDALKRLPLELDDGCLNLLPIMAHELGHAFGLRHIDDPDGHALMDSRFSRDALTPTDRDAAAFAAVLERSIVGGAPGELTMESSDGVQPPADYAGCAPPEASGSQVCR